MVFAKFNVKTKVNAYAGYVLIVISYASRVWRANNTETNELEKVQQKNPKIRFRMIEALIIRPDRKSSRSYYLQSILNIMAS